MMGIINIRLLNTVMCCLMTGIQSEKSIIKRFHHCANSVECTYPKLLHPQAMRQSLVHPGCKPPQPGTVLNAVGNYNTVISTCAFKHI